METKEKYPREQGSMKLSSGNARTTINLYKFSLTRDVHGGTHRRKAVAMLNREQIRETCGNMETEGNFGREKDSPARETVSALCQPCLKEIHIFQLISSLTGRATAFQSLFLCLHSGITVSGEITRLGLVQSLLQQLFFSLSHLEIV